LLVNSAWPESWGGGEKWTVEAAAWLRDQRHSVAVAGRPDSLLVQAARQRELETIEFKFAGDFDPFATARAKRVLKEYRPDCLVVNFNKEAWLFGRPARSLKIPVVARHGFPLLQNKFHHRYLLKRVITKLIVNAESIRDGYVESGLAAAKATVILNGVKEVDQKLGELRQRYHIKEDEILILSAGRMESQKRFDRVIDLARLLCTDNKNLRFVILGTGPLRDDLQNQIDSAGLKAHVHLGKFVRDFAHIAGDADLFLMTSDNEGSPNALMEAMAAGVCCLSTSVGSVPQLFGEDFKESIFNPDDQEETAENIRKLVKDGETRNKIGQEMRSRVLTQFSFEKSMREYENLLAQLCLGRQ
jgi:glycosyltransferase involved in cell wall biosynthesis